MEGTFVFVYGGDTGYISDTVDHVHNLTPVKSRGGSSPSYQPIQQATFVLYIILLSLT